MSTFKAIIMGITAGLVIGGVWNLQESDYILGTIVGVVVFFGWLVIASKKVGR